MTVGWDINASNTGPRYPMTVYPGSHWASDFGGSADRKNFNSGTIFQNVNNGVYNDCQFGETFQNEQAGVVATNTVLNYCAFVANNGVGPYGIGNLNYTLWRCRSAGFSDGFRANGGLTRVWESYFTCALSPGDHNDGGQSRGGVGFVDIGACNIDLSSPAGLQVDGCVLFADYSGPLTDAFTGQIRNSLLNPGPGEFTVKLLDGLNRPNVKYVVTGNRMFKGNTGYFDRGNTPLNQITWANNVDAVTGASIPIS